MTPSILGTLGLVVTVSLSGGLIVRRASRMSPTPAMVTVVAGACVLAVAAFLAGQHVLYLPDADDAPLGPAPVLQPGRR